MLVAPSPTPARTCYQNLLALLSAEVPSLATRVRKRFAMFGIVFRFTLLGGMSLVRSNSSAPDPTTGDTQSKS